MSSAIERASILLLLFKAQNGDKLVKDFTGMNSNIKIKDLVLCCSDAFSALDPNSKEWTYVSLDDSDGVCLFCYSVFVDRWHVKNYSDTDDPNIVSVTWEKFNIMEYISLEDKV